MRNVFIVMCSLMATTAHADDASWRALPLIDNGQVHADWKMAGWGAFEVDGKALVTRPDPRGLGLLVYAKEKFGNCEIRIVYRVEHERSNAGVFVRIGDGIVERFDQPSTAVQRNEQGGLSDEELEKLKAASEADEGAWYAVHHGFEVQICDTGNPLHRTGAIYSLASSKFQSPADPDAWRTMIITLDGDQVRVAQDGKPLTVFNPAKPEVAEREWYEPKREPQRPQSGYIGLQVHDPGDKVWFREVSVRKLDR